MMQKNRIEIAGYLAAKPEQRFLPSGTRVANARLGESYRYSVDHHAKTHTNWHSLSFYGDMADLALECNTGDNLFIEGSIQQREFVPKDGSKRIVNEIIVRSFHLIAPLAKTRHDMPRLTNTTSEEPSQGDILSEDSIAAPPHRAWPV